MTQMPSAMMLMVAFTAIVTLAMKEMELTAKVSLVM